MVSNKHSSTSVEGSSQSQAGIGRALVAPAWQPEGPTLRFKELLKIVRVSRSKAYELMKFDPDFPKGIPLYDSEQSPKFYWTHEAMAWVEARSNKFRNQQKGN